MPIIKCKMCGGDLRIEEGSTVCECEYCGTRQTVPSADNEKKLTLFNRAGRLLRACEFDKAAGVFEAIVADFPEEAEAYWGLVLCKYGIEYVDDPATGKKIPTCHRSSFESVLDDPNFEQACENTDAVARRVYRDEARQIEELRQAILQVSGKEAPYDVFISYKETDENGERTLDSVIAQDIYRELTNEGYRVFFSRISLEDKLGTEYEPYIFAALNSAKVMLVVGTDYENFDSVWVKNEWSRYLKLIEAGQKKTLIPVFKNMDAYDMPKEFKKLAAQDIGKVGAMQDLVRGIEKLVGKKKPEQPVKETVVVQQSEGTMKTAAAVKRGNLALEDGEFDKAKEFFDQALALDAECAEAYLGLALANEQCKDEQAYITRACAKKGAQEMLSIPPDTQRAETAANTYYLKNFLRIDTIRALFDYDLSYPSAAKGQAQVATQEKSRFENNRNLSRAFRFAKGETAERLNTLKTQLYAGLDQNVAKAKEQEEAACAAKTEAYAKHLDTAEQKAAELRRDAEVKREVFYHSACRAQEAANSVFRYREAIDSFEEIADYKDSTERIAQCEASIRELEKQERLRKEAEKKAAAERAEAERIKKEAEEKAAAEEAERQRVLAERAAKEKAAKQKKHGIIAGILAAVAIAAALIVTKVIIPGNQYKAAEALYKAGQYEEAIAAFEALNGYKDSGTRIEEAKGAILARDYAAAEKLLKAKRLDEAVEFFESLGDYNDSAERAKEAKYAKAEELFTAGDIARSAMAFYNLADYKDALERSFGLWNHIAERNTIATGELYTVGINSDGSVVAAGDNGDGQCDVAGWTDVVAIAAGSSHTVGLKADGTVIAAGNNSSGQCNVNEWYDIVSIAASHSHTIGLKADGSVVAAGDSDYGRCDVSEWSDIVAVAAGGVHTVGLKADGTVVATECTFNLYSGQCDVTNWQNIIAIAAGGAHTVGLKSDGTVVAVGSNSSGECNVHEWKEIVSVAAGNKFTIGLKADGNVVAVGDNYRGECNTFRWSNILYVFSGSNSMHTVGLKSGGRIVATGWNEYGQCDVSGWTGIKLPNSDVKINTTAEEQGGQISEDQANRLQNVVVGDSVLFGTYEQDNNTANGQEPIEWLVLAKESNRILVISKYALDCQQFNYKKTDISWEKSSIREWFPLKEYAFTQEELKMIPSLPVSADKNPKYNTAQGNNTTDRFFLLSIEEAEKYFTSDASRKCKPTSYAKAQGCYVDDAGNCSWWLRTMGFDSQYASYVFYSGEINYHGGQTNYGRNNGAVDTEFNAVRPAMWIDLSAN